MRLTLTIFLWILLSNPTKAQLVFKEYNLCPTGDSYCGPMTIYDGKAYFTASNGPSGYELFVCDGTDSGTHLFMDIAPGNLSSYPANLFVFNNRLYFSALNDSSRNVKDWVTDGTANGTFISTLLPAGEKLIALPMQCNGTLYIPSTRAIYAFDSSSQVLAPLRNIVTNDSLQYITWYNANDHDSVFLQLFSHTDSIVYINCGDPNWGTWIGSNTSTHFRKSDINLNIITNSTGGLIINPPLATVNNRIYFTNRLELYSSNFTHSGTVHINAPSSVVILGKLSDKIYIGGWDTKTGTTLLKTEGTDTFCSTIKTIEPAPSLSKIINSFVKGNKLYFCVYGGTQNGLWVTDGTDTGTRLVSYINADQKNPQFTDAGNRFYYVSESGYLATSDGTPAGTQLLIPPYPLGAYQKSTIGYNNLMFFNGALYFYACYNADGAELWSVTDLSANSIGYTTRASTATIDIFPNPAKDLVYIHTPKLIKGANISLFDIAGKKVSEWNTDLQPGNNVLKLKQLPQGTYLMRLQSPDINTGQKLFINN